MTALTASELEYLGSQRLGRIATIGSDGVPHVVPVGFRYNADDGTLDIAGYDMQRTQKYINARNKPDVAFVVDDVPSTNPWKARGVQIRGTATVTHGQEGASDLYSGPLIRIQPRKVVSWGI